MTWPLLFAALLSVATLPQLCAQHWSVASAHDVSFTIHAERRTYKLGEQVIFKYRVRNVSHGELLVPRSVWGAKCGSGPHIWASLEGSFRKQFTPGYGFSCLGPDIRSAAELMRIDALLLKPTEQMEGVFTLDTRLFIKELKPGNYLLQATLYGWKLDRPSDAQTSDPIMSYPFLVGELCASQKITLTR
jgi:hypothetical protein